MIRPQPSSRPVRHVMSLFAKGWNRAMRRKRSGSPADYALGGDDPGRMPGRRRSPIRARRLWRLAAGRQAAGGLVNNWVVRARGPPPRSSGGRGGPAPRPARNRRARGRGSCAGRRSLPAARVPRGSPDVLSGAGAGGFAGLLSHGVRLKALLARSSAASAAPRSRWSAVRAGRVASRDDRSRNS
jgi:hypothetical protein